MLTLSQPSIHHKEGGDARCDPRRRVRELGPCPGLQGFGKRVLRYLNLTRSIVSTNPQCVGTRVRWGFLFFQQAFPIVFGAVHSTCMHGSRASQPVDHGTLAWPRWCMAVPRQRPLHPGDSQRFWARCLQTLAASPHWPHGCYPFLHGP